MVGHNRTQVRIKHLDKYTFLMHICLDVGDLNKVNSINKHVFIKTI